MLRLLFRPFVLLARGLWSVLGFLRRAVPNLILLLLVLALLAVWFRPPPTVPDEAVLWLKPEGTLVEQARFEDPLDWLPLPGPFGGKDGAGEVALHALLKALDKARDDARIRAVVIETDLLEGGGLSKLAELRAALAQVRAAGKPVIAFAERFTPGQYYLASVADEVHLSPDGFLLFNGLSRFGTYYAALLERLGVQVNVFRAGRFKSLAEAFTRADMSDEDRVATGTLLSSLWRTMVNDVAASRALDPASVRRYADDYPVLLRDTGGDAAKVALEVGLVTHLSWPHEWRKAMRDRFGLPEPKDRALPLPVIDDITPARQLGVGRYLAALDAEAAAASDDRPGLAKIAVMVAQGAILDGSVAPDGVAGDAFAARLDQLALKDDVKAVVVRIDSPGGSAWGSERVRRALLRLREAGKPVVASMSSVAASGGYWIAAGADEIWAHPATITGSIGVIAMLPDLSGALSEWSVGVDGVQTGPLAGAIDPRRPLSPGVAGALQDAVDFSYQRFLTLVAEARGSDTEAIDEVAQGRVWSGEDALRINLVDGLGGIDDAVNAAATRAGLAPGQYEPSWLQPAFSPRQALLRRLRGEASVAWLGLPPDSPFARLFGDLNRQTRELLSLNDPQQLYAYCFCESP